MFVEPIAGTEAEPARLAADVIEAVRARDRAEARLLAALGVVISTNSFTADGSTSAVMWLRRRVDLDVAEASRLVGAATRLSLAPRVASAVEDGSMSCRRADLVTRPLANPRVRAAFTAEEEAILAETAPLSATQAARYAAMWERSHDGDAFASATVHVNRVKVHVDQHGRRIVHAVLEPTGGAVVEVELRGIAEQLRHSGSVQPEEEQLTGEVLLGAALVEMAARASGSERRNPAAPVTVLNIPEDRLDDFLATHADTTDQLVDLDESQCGCGTRQPAEYEGTFVTNGQMRRLLCDSILYALVVGSDGAILRLGRAVRTATSEQRLLLALRDGGCVFPGCTMAPNRCRAHHIEWWSHDGPTDISNLCLVCDVHHQEIHGHRWTVEQDDTGHTWTHLRTGRVERKSYVHGLSTDPPSVAAAA